MNSENQKIAYLFPGQGSQFIGMGQDLYENFSEAKNVYDKANAILGFDIKEICFKGPQEKIQQTRYAQAAIFVTSMAALSIVEKKRSEVAGTQPIAAAGLSLGEASALTSSGALSLDDGIRFVRDRGLFMDEASLESPGKMAAVLGSDLETIEKICEKTGAEIGNLNCPGQIVISGELSCVDEAIKICQSEAGAKCIPLDVSGAFHSKCMQSASAKIETVLRDIAIHAPQFAVISNLTAEPEANTDQIKANLVKQMNHRTLWEESMRRMIQMGVEVFYEIGPGKVLKGLMRKIDRKVKVVPLGTTEDFKTYLAEDSHAASG